MFSNGEYSGCVLLMLFCNDMHMYGVSCLTDHLFGLAAMRTDSSRKFNSC